MALLLLLFFVLFFAVAFFWPTWRLWRRDRVNAVVLPYDDTAHGVVAKAFRMTLFGIFALLGTVALGLPPEAVGSLGWLERSPLAMAAGWTLLAVSLLWILIAQSQMGASWRIGIDTQSRPPLVTTGVFALSRNPIFLGMRVSLLGLFLTLPNAVTLALLVTGEVLMQVQVRLEEKHLDAAFGPDYRAYRTAVGRWLRFPPRSSQGPSRFTR